MIAPPLPPEIRYRLMDLNGAFSVRWLCGSTWLLVHDGGTQASAREWINGMVAQQL